MWEHGASSPEVNVQYFIFRGTLSLLYFLKGGLTIPLNIYFTTFALAKTKEKSR
jgi:hypothetical protein